MTKSDSKKLLHMTIFMAIFFGFCVFQGFGERDDWPFSYFGMYKKPLSANEVVRVDVDALTPDGQVLSVYNMGVNAYWVEIVFRGILETQKDSEDIIIPKTTPEIQEQLKKSLRQDIVPLLTRRQINPDSVLRVRYRFWLKFKPENIPTPDVDYVFLEVPWKNL